MAHVKRREDQQGGAFFVEEEGQKVAELTFTKKDPHLVSMDHTFVATSLRGRGIARQLLDAGVTWAREHEAKIIPICPYVRAEFDKDPTLGDVRSA